MLTLVESEISETSKEKRLSEKFKCMNFAHYQWHFGSQVPPSEQLNETQSRLAWHRDLQDETIEKVTKKILNRKTGTYEDHLCMYIDIGLEASKDQVAAEKRQASVVSTKSNADAKTVQRAKSEVLTFLSMSGDDQFFAVSWLIEPTGYRCFF